MPRSPRPGEPLWPTASAADPPAMSHRRPSSTGSPRAGWACSTRIISPRASGRRTGICGPTWSAIRRCTGWRRRSPGSSSRASGLLLLAHTGDSRAYRVRDGILTQQTRDDSYVQALVDRGMVSAADAASHPRRNLITASLSGAERDAAVVVEYRSLAGDRWMLCSDGLSDYVPDAEFAALLRVDRTVDEAAAACVALALEAGTRDNVTVVVCDVVSEPAEPGTTAIGRRGRAHVLRCGRGPLHGTPRVGLSLCVSRRPAGGRP